LAWLLVLPPSAIESTNAPSLEGWTRSLPRPDHGSAPGRPTLCNASIWADPHRRWSEPASGNRTGPWGLEAGLVGPVSRDATRCFPACPALLVRPGPVSAVASVPRMHARHPRRVVARGDVRPWQSARAVCHVLSSSPLSPHPRTRRGGQAGVSRCHPRRSAPLAYPPNRLFAFTDHGPRATRQQPEPGAERPPAQTRGSPHHDER